MIDLNPGPNYRSYARGVRDGQQVGAVVEYAPGGAGQLPYEMASIWHGSASSWVNLQPSGYEYSAALATNGPEQVGVAIHEFSITAWHAYLWHGTAASAIDLNAFLPAGYDNAQAMAIDRDGTIAGLAYQSSQGSTDQYAPTHMVIWTPRRSPGDVNLDGAVDFSDLLTLVQHYGQGGGWVDGDMNGDGAVNFDDLLALAQHYGQTAAETYAVSVGAAQAAPVPEPGFTPLLIAVACAVRARRRRTGKAGPRTQAGASPPSDNELSKWKEDDLILPFGCAAGL